MVHFVLFLVHGVDAGAGPKFQESLKQQPTKVHYKGGGDNGSTLAGMHQKNGSMRAFFTLVRFGSDPSELENPASLADTQAAKQSLSSNVMVSICPIEPKQQ